MLSIMLSIVLMTGSNTTTHRVEPIDFFFPADFMSASPGVHWSGFDAPEGKSVTITKLMWNQRSIGLGIGTIARFEVIDTNNEVVCFIDVPCLNSPGVDVRASCSIPYTIQPGTHINLQGNASNTCQPSGMLQVIGTIQ